jgi:hypothetical protein
VAVADLPEPLTPANYDLRGFPFMPLEAARLRKSKQWRKAKKRPELAFYMLNLWLAAWHELPAGSLPDDDEDLADFAMCSNDDLWAEIKPLVMRGWMKCSDGRLYHYVVAEKVLDAWGTKRVQKNRTEAARVALAAKKASTEKQTLTAAMSTKSVTDAATEPTVPVTDSKRQDKTRQDKTGIEATTTVVAPRRDDDGLDGGVLELTGTPDVPPPCPHLEILKLWAEKLPALPQHDVEHWGKARRAHLQARWRETAVLKRWRTQVDGLTYFRKLFHYIGQSKFLTGRAKARDGKPPFTATLAWIVNPENWAKTHEGTYHHED